jgi:hypothetical protein
LQPRWQQHKQRNKSENWILKDWVQYLTTHAATSSLGKSVRQVERRIKSWTGRPLRELRGIGRAEQVLFELAISAWRKTPTGPTSPARAAMPTSPTCAAR